MENLDQTKSTGRRGRAARLALATLALSAGSCAGIIGVAATAAHAQSFSTLVSMMDWLNVAVRGGSTSPGTDVIQWWADGGAEQEWALGSFSDYPSGTSYIVNENSGLCLATDGVAGDPLTQEPCSANNALEAWKFNFSYFNGGFFINNPESGLNMDVSGASYWGGAEIDGWYPNGQQNQVFGYLN
jgi:Ricin-type beta-trefoil lectin domain-like